VPTVRHGDCVGSRLDVLQEDDRAIVRAASQASKAADYLLGFAPDAAKVSATPPEKDSGALGVSRRAGRRERSSWRALWKGPMTHSHSKCGPKSRGQISSDVMVLKTVGRTRRQPSGPSSRRRMIELSQQFPRPLIEIGMSRSWNTAQGCDCRIALQAVAHGPADVRPWCHDWVSAHGKGREKRSERQRGGANPLPPRFGRCRSPISLRGPAVPVRAVRREILRHGVRHDRPSVLAVHRALEAPPLPRDHLVLPHQSRRAMPPDPVALIHQVAEHARTAIGAFRQGESCADMCQMDHVLLVTTTGRTALPGEEAALADARNTAHPADREAGLLCSN
jgi:hypothetical protein